MMLVITPLTCPLLPMLLTCCPMLYLAMFSVTNVMAAPPFISARLAAMASWVCVLGVPAL